MRRIWIKFALILMLVSVSGILLSTIFSVKEMDYHFSVYLEEMSRKHSQEIMSLLAENYKKEGKWDEDTFAMLPQIAKVLDWELTLYDINRRFIGKFGERNKLNAEENTPNALLPIKVDNTTVGFLSIQHDDTTTTKNLEDHFQQAHTNAMQWTMLILTILVCVVSIIIARRIVRPITNMSKAAISASKGDLSVRVPTPQGKDELTDLVKTFNHLVITLQTQEDLRKRLTSDIAHELRTPLNTLLAQVEGMIDGIWEANNEHLESTRSVVLRLTGLVNDLDQVIQTEAGSVKISVNKVDVSKIADKVTSSMIASFHQKGINVICNLEQNAYIEGDEQRLSQVFTNLLSNSLKHSSQNGKVAVSVKRSNATIVVKVADDGIGIAEKDLPFVFERFYRGDRSRQRGTGGSGLGLTIVKGIVESHGGSIKIESEIGVGTSVTIVFPSFSMR